MVSAAERRKAQARPFIRRAPDSPLYGSEEYLALPDGHPAKIASVYKAAEASVTEVEERLAALDAELMFRALEAKRSVDAAYVAQRDKWRRDWTGRGFRRDPAIAADIEREWREWVSA